MSDLAPTATVTLHFGGERTEVDISVHPYGEGGEVTVHSVRQAGVEIQRLLANEAMDRLVAAVRERIGSGHNRGTRDR